MAFLWLLRSLYVSFLCGNANSADLILGTGPTLPMLSHILDEIMHEPHPEQTTEHHSHPQSLELLRSFSAPSSRIARILGSYIPYIRKNGGTIATITSLRCLDSRIHHCIVIDHINCKSKWASLTVKSQPPRMATPTKNQ